MSTGARKARKKAGEKLVREAKVGTPLLERASFLFVGSKSGIGQRSQKKQLREMLARDEYARMPAPVDEVEAENTK